MKPTLLHTSAAPLVNLRDAGCDSNNFLNLRNILLFVAHDGSLSLSSQRKPFGLPLENLTPKLKHG
jgi:hypothetical protein